MVALNSFQGLRISPLGEMLNQVQHDMEMKGVLVFGYGLWLRVIDLTFQEDPFNIAGISSSIPLSFSFSRGEESEA